MKKYVLVIGLVIAVAVMLTGCIDDIIGTPDDCRFQQTLYQYETGTTTTKQNYVMFKSCTLDKLDDTSCEIVFASIIDYIGVVFYYDGVQWDSWVPGRNPIFNDLDTINPGIEYVITVIDAVNNINKKYNTKHKVILATKPKR